MQTEWDAISLLSLDGGDYVYLITTFQARFLTYQSS